MTAREWKVGFDTASPLPMVATQGFGVGEGVNKTKNGTQKTRMNADEHGVFLCVFRARSVSACPCPIALRGGGGCPCGGEEPHPDGLEQSACPLGPLPRGEGIRLISFLSDGKLVSKADNGWTARGWEVASGWGTRSGPCGGGAIGGIIFGEGCPGHFKF